MILITMAGQSARFYAAGYTLPKYALALHGRTVFDWAVSSFNRYFKTENFVFVVRPDCYAKEFIERAIPRLGIENFQIHQLAIDTSGQAETAYLAIKEYPQDFSVTIFNIDTIRFDYQVPSFIADCDGYLEVFRGEGDHWSFVEPGPDLSVLKTAEKQRISELCSDGLYYFKSKIQFCNIFEKAQINNERIKGEFYIAPLYNRLVEGGGVVKYCLVDKSQLAFCGTPEEYKSLQLNQIL